MNWSSCIRIFARRGWIVLSTVVLALTVAFVQSAAQKPVYRAVQRILLQPERADSNSANLIKYAPDTYTSWLTSLAHASQVINALELDMAPHELQATVTIDLDAAKGLLNIAVEMQDAAAAELIAKSYGGNFVSWVNAQNPSRQDGARVSATLWDHPQLATKETLTAGVITFDALLGALVGLVIVYGRTGFDKMAGRLRSHNRGQFVHPS